MSRHPHPDRRAWLASAALWAPGLAVALGAAVATAHGLYGVAVGAGVAHPIAWLYPLITDGLALVAYAATTRLDARGRRYAWCVVVLAAGLSGLAQAGKASGWIGDASPAMRFGVGAWPAIAAAIVAHLLFLLGVAHRTHHHATRPAAPPAAPSVQPAPAPPAAPAVQASVQSPVQRPVHRAVQPRPPVVQPQASPARPSGERPAPVNGESPARERARAAARRHATAHGNLPTVTQLISLAEVSRGTAHAALKDLRAHATTLHVVPEDTARTQP